MICKHVHDFIAAVISECLYSTLHYHIFSGLSAVPFVQLFQFVLSLQLLAAASFPPPFPLAKHSHFHLTLSQLARAFWAWKLLLTTCLWKLCSWWSTGTWKTHLLRNQWSRNMFSRKNFFFPYSSENEKFSHFYQKTMWIVLFLQVAPGITVAKLIFGMCWSMVWGVFLPVFENHSGAAIISLHKI